MCPNHFRKKIICGIAVLQNVNILSLIINLKCYLIWTKFGFDLSYELTPSFMNSVIVLET